MSTKLTNLVTAHYVLLARSFVVILGCIAVWWGIVGFPGFWRESSAQRIAYRIIAGEPYKIETLARQLPIIDSIERSAYCRPAALRSATIIRLRLIEERHLAAALPLADTQIAELQKSLKKALACAPSDPFLWLVLFWSINQNPSDTELEYLRLSYRLGPNEGWIALKRNHLAFTLFESLSAELKENAIAEFTGLLSNDFAPNSGLYGAVLDIFVGPAWRVRDKIVPRLIAVSERIRQSFAEALYEKGYSVAIPNIKIREQAR